MPSSLRSTSAARSIASAAAASSRTPSAASPAIQLPTQTPPSTPRAPLPRPPQQQQHHQRQLQQTHCFSTRSPAMSSMPASHGHSAACCNIPPVVSKGYQAKGSYEEIGGYKTYVTGPADATKAIVVIFDIFGYFDQTLQGADILAYSDDHQKYKVFMPDWFNGKPLPIEVFPPKTEEQQKQLGDFFGTYPPPKIAGLVPDYVKAIKDKNSSLSKFGILGFCWGGKVVALSTKADTNPFSVAAVAHPAMVDPADADGLKIPFALLASGDEPAEDVKKFEDALTVPKHVETFGDQIHGWMAARSDLSQDRVKAEYERGYKTVLEFFGKNF